MNEHNEEWQKGNDAKIASIQRMIEHERWLKQQHKDVKDKILQRNKPEEGDEPPVQGFIRD